MNVVERFWAKVNKTDTCWLWTATKTDGYGMFRLDGRMQLAHRISYAWQGVQISKHLSVDHTCHVRNCVRPEHLRLTTNKQNGENRAGAWGKSGIRGVYPGSTTDTWEVRVKHKGRSHYGGTFRDVDAAERAAIDLRNRLFSHNLKDRQLGS